MPATGSLSDPGLLRLARELRAATWLSELSLYALLAAAVLAFGGVRPSAYVPMWWATVALVALLAWRGVLMAALRRRIGPTRFAFHPSGLWLVLEDDAPYGMTSWGFDLGRPLLPAVPLLLPLALACGLALLQLAPLPPELLRRLTGGQAEMLSRSPGEWLPISVAEWSTRRGLAFLLMALGLHAVASSLFDRRAARGRLERVLAGLGLLLSLIGLVQMATGTREIYGLVRPRESDGGLVLFGPFVNRNHFAGYMLLVAPVALGLLVRGLSRYRERLGPRANLRRVLVGLQSVEGRGLFYALVPAVACLAALVASNSRSGLVALVGALAVTGALQARRRRAVYWAVPLAVLLTAFSWFGLQRTRFGRVAEEASGRTLVWKDTLARMDGYWLLGSGFNTFGAAMSRVTLWELPKGATPWREPYESSLAQAPRMGYLAHEFTRGLGWYREAHNDYLQVLVELGLAGLLLALWAAWRVLRSLRARPWLFAAVLGLLLQSLVEFSLQLPAVAALFVVLAACGTSRAEAQAARSASETIHS